MSVYFTMLALISILLVIYSYRGARKDLKKVLFILVTLILLFVAGFRYQVGTDYMQYQKSYSLYKLESLTLLSQPMLTIVALVAEFLYDDPATWFFLMSVITIVPVMKTIWNHSALVSMSILMYLFLGCWHYSFNIVKQSAAAAIIFAAYPALKNREFFKWCLGCAIAALFHVSALLMVPVYFLIGTRISTKRTIFIVAIGIAVTLSYETLFELIAFLKQGESVVQSGWKVSVREVNTLRILVNCVPILLFVMFYKHYDKENAEFAVLFNASLVNAMLNVASMNSVYLNRFCTYTNIFNILFIPMLFKPLRKKRTFWIPAVAVILYCAFWAYDLYKGSSTVVFRWIFDR